MSKPAPHSHTPSGDPAHLGCGGGCRYLNHLGQKVLRKWKLGQSPNSTVVICHFKGTPPERTKSVGEKALSSQASFTCSENPGAQTRHHCSGQPGGWGHLHLACGPLTDTQHTGHALSSPRHTREREQGAGRAVARALKGSSVSWREGPCCCLARAQPELTATAGCPQTGRCTENERR